MPSRGTTAFYRQLGIDGAVARDREEYVRLAVELANDPARRDELAAAITDHAGNLFGRAEPIAELEEYFAASVSETAD